MPRTIEGVIQYARDHPQRDGESWAGMCESFVWRAGGFNGSFNTALLAGTASKPLNPNWGSAPRGAIHYWAGVWIDDVECGHVAFELGGGTLLMASSRTSNYGTALGTIHFTDYNLPNYRGWSIYHGKETLAGISSTAGNGYTHLEEDMAEEASVQEAIRIGNVTYGLQLQVLAKLATIEAEQADDATEASVQEAVRVSNETWKLTGQVLAKPSTAIDTTKLIAALKTAGVNVGIDAPALVKLIDASLKDDFGKIPAAVVAGIKAAL